jgi:5-methylcytosine-specific restriction protein A
MKLGNFRSVDPEYTSLGKRGLTRGGKGDRDVWDDFVKRPQELALAAAAIKATVLTGDQNSVSDDTSGITEASEGHLLTRVHVSGERNAKLVTEKKKAALRQHGVRACEPCSFDFSKVYGER